ncbi:ABC transporter permease [Actinomadura craniellae]|uniref:Transport permease protein n=1 Tax=Actinomadura craniellae TaxID=2231787 RepID=A0A365H0U0_9ACTN|nr:ABC transporter permease [Actinomadura craniellae]RAY12704.1 ABC transporter permease [Actinomadura craniellae]
MRRLVTDTGIAFTREITPELRYPTTIVLSMMTPLIFLGLFGPLLTGVPGLEVGLPGASPWQWFLPGIVVLLALTGTAGAGAGLLNESLSGSFERLLVTPMNRLAMLLGRTLKEIVTLNAQALLLILILLPTDFRLYFLGTLVGLVMLSVFAVGIGALSFTLAAVSKSQTVFYGVQQMTNFPLVLLSGVLLPMDVAPGWLHTISRFNPATYLVEAERALFVGDFGDSSVLYGAIASVGIAAVGLYLGGRAMTRVTL